MNNYQRKFFMKLKSIEIEKIVTNNNQLKICE